MFVWAKIPDKETHSESFVERILQKANIFITPGSIFGKNGERYVRVSLCNDITTIEEAIKRIQQSVVIANNKKTEQLA
jgi:aspartate/methionine/tyrosine aminotransferase